jgi:hypothetical protein
MLGWFLSAGLGLFVTSSHLRNRSVQVVLTRPGSPQIWLASVFLSALIVAAATQAVGAIVTFLLSLAWDVPYQIGFLYIALDAVFEAAIVVAILTTLGAVMHPILAVLAALLFNEGTFYSLRYGLELLSFQGHGGGFIAALKPIVTAIHVALPMLDPFSEQTRTVAMSLRVSGADWAYLLATAAYSAGVILVCFLLADVALRRRSFASTA